MTRVFSRFVVDDIRVKNYPERHADRLHHGSTPYAARCTARDPHRSVTTYTGTWTTCVRSSSQVSRPCNWDEEYRSRAVGPDAFGADTDWRACDNEEGVEIHYWGNRSTLKTCAEWILSDGRKILCVVDDADEDARPNPRLYEA